MYWHVEKDGSVSIKFGDLHLEGGFPGFDDSPIKTVAVQVKEDPQGIKAVYQGVEAEITNIYGRDDRGYFIKTTIKSQGKLPFKSQGTLPRVVNPLCRWEIKGANRFFKQGFGFGGPSGMKEINETIIGKTSESYLTTGLLDSSDNTLVIGAMDHKNFLNRNTISTKSHRWGLNDQTADGYSVFLDIGIHTECISIDGELELPSIHFICGDKPFEVFTSFAEYLAKENKVKQLKPPRYHYCSWYHRGCYFTLENLEELLEGLSKIDPPIPLQAIQIDDGYCPSAGDWLIPTADWPGTMENAFKKIIESGYEAGIWVAPFMVGSESKLCKEHPEWLLKDKEGKPIVEWLTIDGGAKNAAHRDEYTYILDTSHPGAFEYVRNVFRTFRKWGATFYKTDFMDWGYQDSTKCKRFTPGKTSAQYFRDVIQMIREEIGEESYWLACISPFQAFIGLADGVRIGNDFLCSWAEHAARHLVNESTADQYFNNVLWQNDPDVTYVRDILTEFNEDEVFAIAVWNGMIGGSVNTSDPLHRVSKERLALWRFLQPGSTADRPKVVDWDKPGIKKCLVRHYPEQNAWAIFVLNITDDKVGFCYDLKSLIGETEAFVYEWDHLGSKYVGKTNTLAGNLPRHGGKLYYVSKENQPPVAGMTLGGSLEK